MSKSDLHRVIDELPTGAEQPALWLLRQLREAGPFETPQALAAALIARPTDHFLLALAAASDDPHLQALSRDPSDPWARSAALAPYDDEPLTDEDRAALAQGAADIAAGNVLTTDELLRRLNDE